MAKDYKYIVATRCMTYNQAPYINETLRGFTIQETSFPCVFIIVDDASDDGEQELLCQWAEDNLLKGDEGDGFRKQMPYGELLTGRHKEKVNSYFVILLLSENLTKTGNGSLKTKYIAEWNSTAKYNAICEGDDYWTHPQKLQMQVDFLEDHSEVGLVYTEVSRYFQSNDRLEKDFFKTLPIKNTHEDFLLNSWFLAPCTWVYRAELTEKIPQLDNRKFFKGDTLWLLTYSKYSQVFFMDEATAVYRVLEKSASHFDEYKKQRSFYRRNLNTRVFFLQDESLFFRLKFWKKVFMGSHPSFRTQKEKIPEWLCDGFADFFRVLFIKKTIHAIISK